MILHAPDSARDEALVVLEVLCLSLSLAQAPIAGDRALQAMSAVIKSSLRALPLYVLV